MVLFYIRHSKDFQNEEATHAHDARLTQDGKDLAEKTGRKLIKRYGYPQIVYCSPFRRTKETMKSMFKKVNPQEVAKIEIIYDAELSRYFTKEEKQNASVDEKTEAANIPIYENVVEFGERTERLVKRMARYVDSSVIVWCITHTTVYKRLSKIYDVTLPSYIPYNHYFALGHPRRIETAPADKTSTVSKPNTVSTGEKHFCPDCGKYHR
jgi:phosphohistidine phosphatase SixA